MVDLRAEREARGLSLSEVSERTRIPAHYLVAMEDGDRATLPPGPFLRGYQRQYLEFLEFDPNSLVVDGLHPPPVNDPDQTQTITMALDEVPLGRLVMSGFVLTMVVVLLLRLLFEATGTLPDTPSLSDGVAPVTEEAPEAEPILPPEAMPTSRLRIRAIEPTRLNTRVDGEDSYRGTLPAGEIIDLEGRQRIEVFSADLTTIRITYNGERIEPLGNLSKPRRLVFVQD